MMLTASLAPLLPVPHLSTQRPGVLTTLMEDPGDAPKREAARGAASPVSAGVPALLQQLRTLGLGERGQKGYAALHQLGRGGGAVSDGSGRAANFSSQRQPEPRGPPTSAFFKPPQQQPTPRQKQRNSLGAAPAAAGSFGTPIGGARPAARVATPDTGAFDAAPSLEDDILFHMSGLKPLRTASRTAAAAAAAAMRSQRKAAPAVHRTQSAPAVDPDAEAAAEARHSPLGRAFSLAAEPSPRARAPPVPTPASASTRAPLPVGPYDDGLALPELADELARLVGSGRGVQLSPDTGRPAEPPPAAQHASPVGSPASDRSAAEADWEAAAPGWSEELLNWMLNEKAGLLVEAQRAAARERQLDADLERERARGAGAEREAQRLAVSACGRVVPGIDGSAACSDTNLGCPVLNPRARRVPPYNVNVQAERRALLDRVQHISAAEAEAAARVERLRMENQALGAELERSQEVCREMLAARRAARDALSEMSAQVGGVGRLKGTRYGRGRVASRALCACRYRCAQTQTLPLGAASMSRQKPCAWPPLFLDCRTHACCRRTLRRRQRRRSSRKRCAGSSARQR